MAVQHDDDTWQRWLVDNCVGALLVIDEAAVVVDVNQVALRELGVARERLVGMPLAELDVDRSGLLAMRAATAGRTIWRTVTLRRANGSPLRTTMRIDRLRARQGWHTLMLAEPADATAHVAPDVRNGFAQITEAIDDVYWLLDNVESRTLYVSSAYERVWGQSRDQIMHDSTAWMEAVHPDDRAHVAAAARNHHLPGAFDVRYRIIRPDGTIRWIRDRAFPLLDDDGGTRRIAGVAYDITAQVQVEDALRANARERGAVLDAVKAQVWYLDVDGRVVLHNRFAGERVSDLVGGPHSGEVEALAPFWDAPAKRHDESMAAIRTGVARLGSIESYAVDDDIHWVSVDKVPTFAEDGSVDGLLVFIYDITALKRAEEQARASTIQLEHANAELESFSYSVSHDLRAPLRSIDGFSRALLDDCGERLDEPGRAHIERVRAATRRMGSLIDALLELSRVTRAELRRDRVDVSELCRQVTAELDRRFPERRIEWVIAPGMTARADLRLLGVVLENVIGNAHKFTGDVATARIEVFCERRDETTWFVVRDNGVGFEAGFARQLFTPFARLHSRLEFPGSGIGLATVRRIVGRHGGEVAAIGSPGVGATFSFSLESPQPEGR